MWKNEYRPPRLRSGDLRTPVTFYEYDSGTSPEPGQSKKKILYDCMANVDSVWLKDLEQAKTNNTVSDLTISIRDPMGDYFPTDEHYVSIEKRGYKGKEYNIKHAGPDPKDWQFINIVGRLVE